MSIYLQGLALRFFRGIGPETQYLAPFKKFNFFIGENNSGKSAVLAYIHEHGNDEDRVKSNQFHQLDVYRGQKTGNTSAARAFTSEVVFNNTLERLGRNYGHDWETLLRKAVDAALLFGHFWIRDGQGSIDNRLDYIPLDIAGKQLNQYEWSELWRTLTGYTYAESENEKIRTVFDIIANWTIRPLPRISLIPAKREIGPTGVEMTDFSGRGLIDRLAELQSPDHDVRHEYADFESINEFLQSVTDTPKARIEIPHHRRHVLVHMNDKVLPLSALGTGIHEVVLLAAFCTLRKNEIVCIEEPEIHLHPIIQRKLVKYLSDNTENQYFIATHSASFIDTEGSAVFHVFNDGTQTRIRESVLRSDRVKICDDLGYKASDIMQSNAVIWVEGPSDRIYINHWIKQKNEKLIEGIHYSIMFYGGRLLSHLDAASDELGEFISLRSLNQNLAIVMDSDRDGPRQKINETKKRLRDGLSHGKGVAWITKGREIENYIPHTVLQSAVKTVYGNLYNKPMAGGQYDHALHFERTKAKNSKKEPSSAASFVQTIIDKVAVAREVTREATDFSILDLNERIEEIVSMILEANKLTNKKSPLAGYGKRAIG